MFYKKVDLKIPLHVHLVFYELNKYTFFCKKSFYKKLSATSSKI